MSMIEPISAMLAAQNAANGVVKAANTAAATPKPAMHVGATDPELGGMTKSGAIASRLPSSLTSAAAKAPKPVEAPKPMYSGPSINSIPHTAQQLGATYNYSPATSTHTVNGTPIPITSTDGNGNAMGSVNMIATASGFPAAHIQTNSNGSVQVMPHTPAPQQSSTQSAPVQPSGGMWGTLSNALGNVASAIPATHPAAQPVAQPVNPAVAQAAQLGAAIGNMALPTVSNQLAGAVQSAQPAAQTVAASQQNKPQASAGTTPATNTVHVDPSQLNGYWQGVMANKGLWQSPLNGETPAQLKSELATKYGIDPSQITVNSAGHAYIPFSALQDYALSQSGGLAGAGASTSASGGTYDQTVQGLLTTLLQALQTQQQNPYASQIAALQQPTFNVDPNALMQQAQAMELPTYQNQIAAQNQTINDQMNKRGIYNSGLAQQAIDSEDATLYNNMDNAAMKDYNSLYTQAQNNYKDQLQAYADQVNALHDAGALSDTQFSQMVTALNDAMSRATAQQSSNTTATNDAATQALNQQKVVNSQLQQLGYAIDPSTGNLYPTVSANTANVNQAVALAKTFGYTVNADGSITPTLQALNASGTTYGANGATTPTTAQQTINEKAQQDTFNNALAQAKLDQTTQALAEKEWQALLPYNNMTADQKAQVALNYAKLDEQRQALQDSMIKAKLPYEQMTKYQQSEITLKQQTDYYDNMLKQVQAATDQQKVALAQKSESFNEWAKTQNVDIANQKLSLAQKTATVDQWVKEEGNALNQFKAAQSAEEGKLKGITTQMQEVGTQMDNIRTNGGTASANGAADSNYIALQNKYNALASQANAATDALGQLAQTIGSIGTSNMNATQK